MPVFHTKTIQSILDPVAQQVGWERPRYQRYVGPRVVCFVCSLVFAFVWLLVLVHGVVSIRRSRHAFGSPDPLAPLYADQLIVHVCTSGAAKLSFCVTRS